MLSALFYHRIGTECTGIKEKIEAIQSQRQGLTEFKSSSNHAFIKYI